MGGKNMSNEKMKKYSSLMKMTFTLNVLLK